MCQPGRPLPHGLSHPRPSASLAFQSAKSSGSRFAFAGLDPRAGDEVVDVAVRELAVAGEGADGEVDVARPWRSRHVRRALGDELLDERDDVRRCSR